MYRARNNVSKTKLSRNQARPGRAGKQKSNLWSSPNHLQNKPLFRALFTPAGHAPRDISQNIFSPPSFRPFLAPSCIDPADWRTIWPLSLFLGSLTSLLPRMSFSLVRRSNNRFRCWWKEGRNMAERGGETAKNVRRREEVSAAAAAAYVVTRNAGHSKKFSERRNWKDVEWTGDGGRRYMGKLEGYGFRLGDRLFDVWVWEELSYIVILTPKLGKLVWLIQNS